MNGNNNSLAWNQCIALKPAEYEQNVCIALAQDIPWEREGAAMMEEELTNGEEENNHLEDHIQGSQQVA
jgi:hypothetical protein